MKRLAAGALIVLAIAAAVALLEPSGTVLGQLRGEKFYDGRPTSFWRKELLDPAPGVQTNTIKALADGGPAAVAVLIDLLRTDGASGGAEVRLSAALALGHIGSGAEPAVPALTEALSDRSADVRLAAAEALAQVGPAAGGAVPAMTALLKEEQPARVVRALKALRRLRGVNHEAIPAFLEATRHADAEVRENAAEALGEAGEAAAGALPRLRELLRDDNENVREEAEAAIKKIAPAEKAP
jgi:HEAT repeat protein